MADVDRCVICGAPVPEGRQICWAGACFVCGERRRQKRPIYQCEDYTRKPVRVEEEKTT
ncbi:MAG: hypothetical protein LIO45_00960 [Clostridiales bacterium]|nr:hypothetical protein [Clostridiales bacterium]